MDDPFGVQHQQRYGLVTAIEDDVVRLTIEQDFGDLSPGDVLELRAGGDANSRALLPVSAPDALVVARDGRGRARRRPARRV